MQFEQTVEVEGEEGVMLHVDVSGSQNNTAISLFFIHGMGSCGATWHNQVSQFSPYFQTICPDLRGHGASGGCDSLHMNLLVKDITNVILALEANVIGTRKVILIGHSVGGCIATFVAHSLAATKEGLVGGVVCLDMAEGTALNALPHMKTTLESWPHEFPSVASCVDWSVRNHHPSKICSAEKSIPPSLHRTSPDGPYTLRPNLTAYEENWQSCSPDRLDNELTVAQMQGKFQLKLIQGGCGEHFLHEDQAEQTLAILAGFFYTSGFISQTLMSTIMTHSMFATFPSHDFQNSKY